MEVYTSKRQATEKWDNGAVVIKSAYKGWADQPLELWTQL